MEKFIEYAPIILIVSMYFYNNHVFVTPVQLERKHREILTSIEDKYATKSIVDDLKEQFSDMSDKIDKIYDLLIKKQ